MSGSEVPVRGMSDSNQVKGEKDSEEIAFLNAPFNRRKGDDGLSGQMYEILLCLLFLLQGIRQKEQDRILRFSLASNMVEAGDFDDVVFHYTLKKKPKKARLILLQAKHTSTKITIGKLLSTPIKKAMFTLRDYFSSYLEIIKRFSPKEYSLYKHCDFIIFTNASFPPNFYKYHKYLTKVKVNKKSILHFKDTNYYYKLKLGVDKKMDEKIFDSLGYASRCRTLAKTLVDSIFPIKKQKTLVIKYDGILKRYWYSLAQIVITKYSEGKGRLNEGFLQGDENLSIGDMKFREVFFDEIRKRKEHSKKSDNNLISELKEKTLILPENFGICKDSDRKLPLPSKLVKAKHIEDFLHKLKLYVNQPDLNDLTGYVKKKIQSAYQVNRKHLHPVFTELERKVLDWWMYSNKFLTETNKFFEEVLRNNISFDVKDPVPNFTGREQQLRKLHKIMQRSPNSRCVVLQTSSVTGLGGVGKTELVRKYIKLYGKHYDDNIIWINAENWRTLYDSFIRLAKVKLQINVNDRNGNQIPMRHIVEEVYMFFCKRKSLFIFDNADRFEPIDGGQGGDDINVDMCLNAAALPSIFKKPNFLITSRSRQWGDEKVLELGTFTKEEAVQFIKRALNIEDRKREIEVINLAKLLQYFPLALVQAVSYINTRNEELNESEEKFGISDYIEMYTKESKMLLNFKLPQEVNDPESKTTYTTWKISIDKIVANEEFGKKAKEILDVIAYCAPEDFPVEVFFETDQPKKEKKLGTAVQLLKSFSMVNSGSQRVHISIHRLVQEVVRLELKEEGMEEIILIKCFDFFESKYPYGRDKQRDYPKKKAILPHLESLLPHIDDWISRKPELKEILEESMVLTVLELMIDACIIYAYHKRRKVLLERALDLKEVIYGKDNYELAETLVNLGNAYGSLGDPQKQKEFLKRALDIQEAHYGKAHPEVATTLNNLGNAYGSLGDPRAKQVLIERALGIMEAHYGKDHLKVATTLGNLGNAYHDLGDHQQSKMLLERVLGIQEAHSVKDHFDVATTLVNLGNTYGYFGDIQKQKLLLERALVIKEAHYGKDHVEVAATLGSLGNAYGSLGDPQKQKVLLERALVIQEDHYGKDHFEVVITLVNLGNAYGFLGDPQTRKVLLERALGIQEAHYGRDHLEVANILINLGNAYGTLGDFHKQKILLERALGIKEAHYERNHFEVGITLDSLGNAYGSLGDPQTQKVLLERALGIQEDHYGKDHFEVAKTLVNLGNAYGSLGDHQKQKVLLERALEIKEAYYGKDHFEVAIALVNLGSAYFSLGETQKQKVSLERALFIHEDHYGKDHPEVANTLVNLGVVYCSLGDPETQKVLLERALVIQEDYYGKDHPQIATTLVNLGNAYGFLGNPQTKKVLLERALGIKETYYGKDHIEVAIALVNLGIAYGSLGDHQEKKVLLERALGIQEAHYGKDHFSVAITLRALGNACGCLGNPQEKKVLLERALDIQESLYGKDHFEVATTLVNLGNAYGSLGDPQKQKVLLERALGIQESHYGKDHFEVASTLVSLGNAYGDLGDHQQKKIFLERALEIQGAHFVKDNIEVAITLHNLGNAYGALGDHHQKRMLLERALDIQETHYGKYHVEVAKTLVNLGNAYGALHDPKQQIVVQEKALDILEHHYGKDHPSLATTFVNLANAYGVLGDSPQKKALLEKAIDIQEAFYERENLEVAKTLVSLGNVYHTLGEPQKGKSILGRALSIFERYNHPFAAKIRSYIKNKFNLHNACHAGDVKFVKTLLDEGCDVVAKDDHDTVLHRAVSGGNMDIIRLIMQEIIERYPAASVEYLNAADSEGDTPLIWAIETGNTDATKILLEYEVDVNIQNQDGETALHWASKCGYAEIVQLLLDNNVDHSIKDKHGNTAFETAMENLNNDPENEDFKLIVGILFSLTD